MPPHARRPLTDGYGEIVGFHDPQPTATLEHRRQILADALSVGGGPPAPMTHPDAFPENEVVLDLVTVDDWVLIKAITESMWRNKQSVNFNLLRLEVMEQRQQRAYQLMGYRISLG
jgi:hypothetical protein